MLHGMTYYHWASDPVRLHKMSYPQSGHPKPNGFWFDVNEEWRRWCETVQFSIENLQYRHTVTILDASRILFLRNAKISTYSRASMGIIFPAISSSSKARKISTCLLATMGVISSAISRSNSRITLCGGRLPRNTPALLLIRTLVREAGPTFGTTA
jgi:hypothetical protein